MASISDWLARNGCSGEAEKTEHGESYCETWSECDAGVEVTHCTLTGMGHCWPGGNPDLCLSFFGPPSDAIEANEVMLDFFEAHPLP